MSENKPKLQDLFIGIAGLIGAGKSTLATALGELTGLPVYYEPVQDNEYLADFYADTAKYAFQCRFTYSTGVSSSTKRSSGMAVVPFRIVQSMKMPSLQKRCSILVC